MPNPSAARRVAALAVLGLPAQASSRQITDAYRRLARTTHPDATGRADTAAARRFTEITDAYHLLARHPAEQAPTTQEKAAAPPHPADRIRPGATWRLQQEPPIVPGPVTIIPPSAAAWRRR